MVAKERIVKLFLDMTPTACAIEGKFRAGQLNQLDALVDDPVQKFPAQFFLLLSLLCRTLHLGSGIQRTMTNEYNLLLFHCKLLFIVLSLQMFFFLYYNHPPLQNQPLYYSKLYK